MIICFCNIYQQIHENMTALVMSIRLYTLYYTLFIET